MTAKPERFGTKAKVAMVVGGYVVAFAAASIAEWQRILHTQGPEAQASSGMYAFGDSVLWVAVFGGLSLVPTTFALAWLRRTPRFWTLLANGAPAFVATQLLAALVLEFVSNGRGGQPAFTVPVLLAISRIFGAPLVAAFELLSACFAPDRRARWLLLASAVLEVVVAFAVIVLWLGRHRPL